MKKKRTFKNFSIRGALPSLVAILIGMVIGVIVLLVSKPEVAGQSIPNLFKGPFNFGLRGVGDMLFYATPILMTGLSVGFAFRTGLFNIGASGQFMVGAFVAILIGAKLTSVPESIRWLIALLGSGIAGALWASIVGVLKAYRNVNEVITSIMLNYTGMYLVNDFIKRFGIYNQMKNNTVSLTTEVPRMGLDKLFNGSFVGGGIVIAVVIAIILHIVLSKTTLGYELKAVGLNRHATKYAGINEKKSIIYSMIIAGALSGLAGGLVYLSGAGKHMSVVDVLPNEGFDGIAVALLGMSHPIGIIFSALFIAYLNMGGQAIQTLGLAPELISMLIAIILYISALSVLFQTFLRRRDKKAVKEELHE